MRFFLGYDYLTDFTSLTKFSAYSENFRQKVTFQIRVKYRKTVFGTKPEVRELLRDSNESFTDHVDTNIEH